MFNLNQVIRQYVSVVKIDMRFLACISHLFFQCRIITPFHNSDLLRQPVLIPLAPVRQTGWDFTHKCVG